MTALAHSRPTRTLVALKAPGDALERLIGLGLNAVGQATDRLQAGGSVARWRAEMERMIATSHQAALIAATAQRLGVPANSALISRQRLSRAEREDIRAAVRGQLAYLDGFQRDIEAGRLSPAQVAARANMYARAIKPFYYAQRWGQWEIPDQLIPGNNACMANCRCTGSITTDNGDGTGVWTRVLGSEQHCDDCPRLAGDHPVKRRQAA